MLVMDNRIIDSLVFKTLASLIIANSVPQDKLVDLFYYTGDRNSKTKDIDYYIMIDKSINSVSLYFPNASKKLQDKTITAEFLVIIDLDVDNDNGESLDKILSKYAIAYSESNFYGSFIDAVDTLKHKGSLLNWIPPEKPTLFDDYNYDNYNDDDVFRFLNHLTEDDESYEEEYYEDDEEYENEEN